MSIIRSRNVKKRWRARSSSDLIREIYLRLLSEGDPPIVEDPLGSLARIATEVEEEWRGRLRPVKNATGDAPENIRGGVRDAIAHAPPKQSILNAFQTLPDHQREALLLHVNERVPYPEIAQRMGVEPETVIRELSDAYAQLWLRLYGEGQPVPDSTRHDEA